MGSKIVSICICKKTKKHTDTEWHINYKWCSQVVSICTFKKIKQHPNTTIHKKQITWSNCQYLYFQSPQLNLTIQTNYTDWQCSWFSSVPSDKYYNSTSNFVVTVSCNIILNYLLLTLQRGVTSAARIA